MSQFTPPDEALRRFVADTVTRQTPLQRRLREETARHPRAYMLSTPDQGALLALLVQLTGARRVLEIGTFTGYSALTMASAMPEDGKLVTCDLGGDHLKTARRYWQEGGLEQRIEVRLGDAGQTLQDLLSEGWAGRFDLAFIDANQGGYDPYYEACLSLLRPGGVMALENMLWYGSVAHKNSSDAVGRAMRALNLKIRDDARVDCSLLTVGDGLMLVRKR